nr:OstA-like protein [Porphyromonas macacae]
MRKNVRLEDKTSVLYTDSLDYDRVANLAYYFDGGTIVDSLNTLSSDYGQYDPQTDDAEFQYNVKLENERYTLTTEHLFYNTKSQISIFDGPTTVVSDDNRIISTRGVYDSKNEKAYLLDRSEVYSGSKKLVGDSIFYDQQIRYGEAFGNMIISDSVRKADLHGDYGFFDETKNYAFATSRAYIKEYSGKDPIYMGADTLEFITIDTLSARLLFTPPLSVEDVVQAKDSTTASKSKAVSDSSEGEGDREQIAIPDEFYTSNLEYHLISDSLPKVKEDSVCRIIKAYPNVKIFKQDVQAVCGYAQMVSIDSVINLRRSPVMWSENNQVKGDSINFFLKGEKLDHVDVYENVFVTEKIGSDMYNQIRAPYMMAIIEDSVIRELRAYMDVMSIRYAQQENSGKFFGLNRVKSTSMFVYFENSKLEKVFLGGPGEGKFFPIHMAQSDEVRKLEGFNWSDDIRPKNSEEVIPKTPLNIVPNGTKMDLLTIASTFSGKEAIDKAYKPFKISADSLQEKSSPVTEHLQDTVVMHNYLLKQTKEILKPEPKDRLKEIIFTPWYNIFITKGDRDNSTTSHILGS